MPKKQAELDRANKGLCTLYVLASTKVVEQITHCEMNQFI